MIAPPDLVNAANNLKDFFAGGYNEAYRAVAAITDNLSKPTIGFEYFTKSGNVNALAGELKDKGYLADITSPGAQFRRGWGAFPEGFLRTFDGKEGYLSRTVGDGVGQPVKVPTLGGNEVEYQELEASGHIPYGNKFFQTSAEGSGYNLPEKVLFRAGAIAGDIVGNGMRSVYWRSSPPDVASQIGQRLTLGAKSEGLPQAQKYVNKRTGQEMFLPGSREAAAMAMLGGMATVEAMNIGSGNYNPLNPGEGFRVAGFSAVSADPDGDRRKPTNMLSEVAQRHILGRKGKLLPWEQFKEERPDVSYQRYEDYKDWQFGKDEDDLLSRMTAGVAGFTQYGLSGMPEVRFMGTTVTPVGALSALTAGLGVRGLNHLAGNASLNRYQELRDVAKTRPLTETESLEYLGIDARNPHARMANRDGTGTRRRIYDAR